MSAPPAARATAAAPATTISPTATILAGQSFVDVTLTPIADQLVEGDETATLTIQASANYQVGSPSSAIVTIHDGTVSPATVCSSACSSRPRRRYARRRRGSHLDGSAARPHFSCAMTFAVP